MASDLGPEEEEIAKQFLEKVNVKRRKANQSPISWKDAVKFCMARKFNLSRALELHNNHDEVRIKERLQNINPCSEDVRKELLTGKLTILDSRDETGAAIALFTARFHNPLASSKMVTLQSLVTQLDAALDSIETQRNGLVFVYDMTDSKFSNFDYDLSVRILDLLKGSFPARLKKVLIVLAPLWFKAPFKILRLFVREKLRDRVYTVNDTEILKHIPALSLPTHLGGIHQVNHLSWLKKCLDSHRIPDPALKSFFMNAQQPNYMTAKFQQHAANIESHNHAIRKNHHEGNVNDRHHRNLPSNNHHNENTRAQLQGNHILAAHRQSAPPSVPPPPVPKTDIPYMPARPDTGNNVPYIPSRLSTDLSPPPQVPTLPPSSEDADPYDSVFSDSIENLLLPTEQLERAVSAKKSGLISEYMRIKNEPHQDTFINARLPANMSKNRYSDVLCYDYTRLVLNPSCNGNDYINANHVNSFKQKRGYICCQGPLPRTFDDFWQMIWQEKVRTVVMTTKLVEKGRTKCGTYWPQEVNQMETYGDINIMNISVEIEPSEDFQVTTLCICNKRNGETRFIKHMLFLKWPDYGIPPSAEAFLHFVNSVREEQEKSVKDMPEWKGHPRGPPIVVHCSAGIGRTGTFICSDICMYLLDNVGKLNIRNVVRLIRSQRAFAIQMPDQYVFCHIAILQYAQKRGMLPSNIDIPKLLEEDDF